MILRNTFNIDRIRLQLQKAFDVWKHDLDNEIVVRERDTAGIEELREEVAGFCSVVGLSRSSQLLSPWMLHCLGGLKSHRTHNGV